MDIYFDNAATTQVSKEAADKAYFVMTQCYGNPSSMHELGLKAELEIKNATQIIADLLKAKPEEIYYTSGATESNNIAILGTADGYNRSGKHIITTKIEHPAVLEPFKVLEKQGFEVTYLDVDANGLININALKNSIRPDTILVSIMYVNNEIGTIQDIEHIGKAIKEENPSTLFHVDAVQAFGKYAISVLKSSIDLLSISGHKLHAPKGIGVLYMKKGLKTKPLVYGGGQQKDIKPGTENVPGIAALAVAAQQAYAQLLDKQAYVAHLKNKLMSEILQNIENTSVNGSALEYSSAYILNVTFEGIRSEVLLHALENERISISSGSACSSHKKQVSSTLKAIGIEDDKIEGAVRFSFSRYNTIEEVEQVVNVLKNIVPMLRRFKRG
jgi:cysteine desulfurase